MFSKLLVVLSLVFLCSPQLALAQELGAEPSDTPMPAATADNDLEVEYGEVDQTSYSFPSFQMPEYTRGVVQEILSQETLPPLEQPMYAQTVKVALEDGSVVEITANSLQRRQLLSPGTNVIVAKESGPDGDFYTISDVYRLPVVFGVVALFVIAVVVIARWQGLFAVIGMGMSLAVLLQFTVPKILSGSNPFMIALVSCVVISFLTLYVAHGWSIKTHIALVSILGILGLVAGLAYAAVTAAHLVGLGSEEAFFLQYGDTAVIDLQGLLLGGILLGALGVLDDIAVSQAAIVFQLAGANKKLGFTELFMRAMHVGRDHIASLVNTLFLAYVGANTALFILFYINEQTPFWVALNSQQIVEEIIRTMVGSLGLVLAVPLTSVLAAWVVVRYRSLLTEEMDSAQLGHRH